MSLKNAVIQQLGYSEDDLDQTSAEYNNLKTTLSDISRYGVDGGFTGFIYYHDTLDFYQQHKDLIIERLQDLADDVGSDSVMLLIKSFRCAQDLTDEEIGRTLYGSDIDRMAANCLAWFAAEEIAHEEAAE